MIFLGRVAEKHFSFRKQTAYSSAMRYTALACDICVTKVKIKNDINVP